MSFAEHTNSLAGPLHYGATAQEERNDEQADAIVARLTARYGDDALKLYLRLEDDDIRREFDDEARDLADEQLWKRMSAGERQLAEVCQGPDAWSAGASVTAARATRGCSTWESLSRWVSRQSATVAQSVRVVPAWVEDVAA